MVAKFAVVVVSYLCVILGDFAYANDSAVLYSACLNQARTQVANQIQQSCLSARSPGDCPLQSISTLQLGDALVAKCREIAGIDTSIQDEFGDSERPFNQNPSLPIPIPRLKPPLSVLRPKQPVTKSAATPPSAAPTQKSTSQSPSQSSESAQSQVDSDIAMCSGYESAAIRCCGDPLSCASNADRAKINQVNAMANAGPRSGQGIAEYCRQLQSASSSGGDVNTTLGGVCAANQGSCHSTCMSLARKYSNLVSSCNGCANESIYQDAYVALSDRSDRCDQLQARANALSSQGLGSASGQGYGSACQNVASAEPSNASGLDFPASSGGRGGSEFEDVAAKTASAALAANRGSDGFTEAAKDASASTFDVPDSPAGRNSGYRPQDAGHAPPPGPAGVVANNGGGAIPGQGGSDTSAALTGGKTVNGSKASPGSSGFTDILQGERSGGYSRSVANNDYDQSNRGFGRTGLGRAVGAGSHLLGMDLRQYLPGGQRDPDRHLGGLGSERFQINGKGEDIFKIISNKMVEKCRLGILWECRP